MYFKFSENYFEKGTPCFEVIGDLVTPNILLTLYCLEFSLSTKTTKIRDTLTSAVDILDVVNFSIAEVLLTSSKLRSNSVFHLAH